MYVNYYFMIFLISVYFSFSDGKILNEEYVDPTNDSKQQAIIHQFEDKIKNSILGKLEDHIDTKLNNLEKNLSEKLKKNMDYHMDILLKKVVGFENNMNDELFNMKNSILVKVEEYIDKKINDSDRNISEKLKQNMDYINLEVFVKNNSNEIAGNINCKSKVSKKITELEDNMNRKLEVLVQKIPIKFEENMNFKIDALATNISKQLEVNNNFILNTLTKVAEYVDSKHQELEGNKNGTSDSAPPVKVPGIPNVDCGKLPPLLHGSTELLNGTTHLGSVVQYSCTTNYRLVGPARRTCAEDFQWSDTAPTCEGPCKEETLARDSYTPWYSLDGVSLRHSGTLRRDSAGRRAYLELRFALQADGVMYIQLWEIEGSGIQYALYVGESSNQRTELYYNGNKVQNISTPDILSATEFRSFYIKGDDGKLQFGKEGDAPLISYSAKIGLINYYRMSPWTGSASIRYCPAAIKGSS